MWTTKKLVLTGLFGGLVWALHLAISLPIVAIAGLGMGAVIMPFITTFSFILFKQIISDFWSATMLGLVVAMLFVPLPFFGPSGFLPKIIILLVAGFIFDVIFSVLSKKPKASCIISCLVGSETAFILTLALFVLLGVPAAQKFISLAIPFAIAYGIEGALGGYCGYLVYKKIENKSFIKQIQS